MQKSVSDKMPTGISSLDPILDGGVPPGSVILLLGDLGGGNYEFAYSSMINLLDQMRENSADGIVYPKEVRYITFTRQKDDIRKEILHSFRIDRLDELVESIQFNDLSEQYFDNSVVPDEWYSQSDIITRLHKRSGQDSVLAQLSTTINSVKPDSLIVLDSITDMASQAATVSSWQNFTGFLRGLQRITKQRNITSYLLLSRGILDASREKELADIADAVILFKWEESTAARRQRVMYFEKFRGVMPHLEEQDLVKFAVRITTAGGFEVSNIRVII